MGKPYTKVRLAYRGHIKVVKCSHTREELEMGIEEENELNIQEFLEQEYTGGAIPLAREMKKSKIELQDYNEPYIKIIR